MTKKPNWVTITQVGTMLAVPLVLWAFSYGPDAHHTAVPGTNEPSCSLSGCHLTPTPVNGGGGNVKIAFSGGGTTYTPGQKQILTITITDSAAKVYGFQMTARPQSNLSGGQAGTFTPDAAQAVLCASASLSDVGTPRNGANCPSAAPIEFVEHNNQPYTTNVINVTWTAPATDVGPVGIYISANAAPSNAGIPIGHIYTAGYTLTAAATGGNPPSITSVNSGSDFGGFTTIAPQTWVEIKGSALATNTRIWGGADFNGSKAPTSLDGTSVTINGKSAAVYYISPTQVNVQAPDDTATGPVNVVLTTAAGASAPFSVQEQATQPGILVPASFKVNGTQYAVAQFQDGTYVGKTGLISGVAFRPAKPGDALTIYGIGFGAVTPTIPAGTIVPNPVDGQANHLTGKLSVTFGQTNANLLYQGLAPNFVGLYQFNVVVPQVSAGDVPITFSLNGKSTGQTASLTIGN